MIPSFERKQRASIIDRLEQSVKAREKYSLRFRYAPGQLRLRHDKFVQLLNSMINLLADADRSKTVEPSDAVTQPADVLEDDRSMEEDA